MYTNGRMELSSDGEREEKARELESNIGGRCGRKVKKLRKALKDDFSPWR
jgi:hypothetical protein